MVKIVKFIIYILLILAVAIGCVWLVRSCRNSEPKEIKTYQAKIAQLTEMADLCTVEIYAEVPVKGRIGKRHFFATQIQQGYISFPVDSIGIEEKGDTAVIYLPKERVEMLESTDSGSFRIIDTWSDGFLQSGHFSADEENRIKLKGKELAIKRLYSDGTVRRARREGKQRLGEMLAALWHRPVMVIDTIPTGKLEL